MSVDLFKTQMSPIPVGFYNNNNSSQTSIYQPTYATSTNITQAYFDNDIYSVNEYMSNPWKNSSVQKYTPNEKYKTSKKTSDEVKSGSGVAGWIVRNKDTIIDFSDTLGYAMEGFAVLSNGSISQSANYMKADNAEYAARQNERAAELLLKNQRDIIRAAQMDSNVYRMQGASVKSEQRIAQAASGFAVGKGINRVTLNTTDARVNYNVAAMMLKAELQNAELTRKAGDYRAAAEVQKGNAEAYRIIGDAEKNISQIKSIGFFAKSVSSFYNGLNSAGAFTDVTSVNKGSN